MENAGFESPLTDEQLKDLGRLVVNFGFVEFLIGMHVGMLLDVNHSARVDLVNPLAMARKIDILKRGLGDIPKAATRSAITEALNLITPAIPDRNRMVHGIWGVDSSQDDARAIALSTKERSRHVAAETISRHADALATASRKLMNAARTDAGDVATDVPERLVIHVGS